MPTILHLLFVAILFGCGQALAQTTVERPAATLPETNDPPVPNGTPVSRPLQLVTLPDVPVIPAPTSVAEPGSAVSQVSVGAGTADGYSTFEMPLWWSKRQRLPALVTASRGGTGAPVLGGPNTVVLIGGELCDDSVHTGFRFAMGTTQGPSVIGLEFDGLFFGTKEASASATNGQGGRYTALGRPFTNATTGQPDALIVAAPNLGPGAIRVATTTRVQGWEVNLVESFFADDRYKLVGVAGYRYFGAYEGLHVMQSSLVFATTAAPAVLWNSVDQVDARNSFHGGQVGLRADALRGRWSLSLVGKVAFGTNFEVTRIEGRSTATTAALPQPMVQAYSAGVLGVPSTNGRSTDAAFAVLPEARLNLGVRVGDHAHFFIGYDLLYLSDAVRPGDQVDTTINPGQVPLLGGVPGPVAVGTFRPESRFVRGDFWVQGLVLGLDCRY